MKNEILRLLEKAQGKFYNLDIFNQEEDTNNTELLSESESLLLEAINKLKNDNQVIKKQVLTLVKRICANINDIKPLDPAKDVDNAQLVSESKNLLMLAIHKLKHDA